LGSSPAFSDDTGKSFSSVEVAGSFHASDVSSVGEQEAIVEPRDWVMGLNLSSIIEELLDYYAKQVQYEYSYCWLICKAIQRETYRCV
jgi:hypothetical protein